MNGYKIVLLKAIFLCFIGYRKVNGYAPEYVTIATATISFIVTVAIVVYKGSISVVGRMLTVIHPNLCGASDQKLL